MRDPSLEFASNNYGDDDSESLVKSDIFIPILKQGQGSSSTQGYSSSERVTHPDGDYKRYKNPKIDPNVQQLWRIFFVVASTVACFANSWYLFY
jgi:hypothetical protein